MRMLQGAPSSPCRWSSPRLNMGWRYLLALLWASMVTAEKTAADYYVRSLPGQPEGPLLKMHAGHIEVDPEHNGHLFFWHFQNRHIANRQRTVIWLNGGPGCSSMDGALMEVGPYRLKDEANLRYNEGSWDEFANLLFVDQPVGTGFSYVNTDSFLHELDEMAKHFMVFLEKYFSLFPEYANDDIYMAGESYAGQHIPYIAQAILKRNDGNVRQKWNLKGLLIGNGWIAPTSQYQMYLPMAYKEHVLEGGSATAKQLESQQALCNSKLNEPGGTERVDIEECEKILSTMLRLTQRDVGGEPKCYNMYDVRLWDKFPACGMNWPPDLDQMEPYLRRRDVIEALHVNPDKKAGWTECVGTVGKAFKAVHSKPSIDILPGLLERMRVVLYSGEKDLICNHMGTEELIHNMAWNGGQGFELSPGTWAPRRDWTFEGEPAGIYQEARNLTYILFYNASHMVPFDFPRRTRDMLDRFMQVDIASIGGTPADSRIDGEKGLEVSVGGHPNSTVAKEKERQKLKQAKWDAYYRSGEVALVIVVIAAGLWGWFIWRDRRRRYSEARYYGLLSPSVANANANANPTHANGHHHHHHQRGRSGPSLSGLERFRHKRMAGLRRADVEAADFDESELDDLQPSPQSDDDDDQDDYHDQEEGVGNGKAGTKGGDMGGPKGGGVEKGMEQGDRRHEKDQGVKREEDNRFGLGIVSDDDDDDEGGDKKTLGR